MAVNGYTVGRDVSLDIIDGNGAPTRFRARTEFAPKQDTIDKKIVKADGTIDHILMPQGWSGTITFERQTRDIDDYFAQFEADYFAGKNNRYVSITETISEADGSTSQYRYTGVVLKLDDAGNRKGDSTVTMKIGFMAQRRLKVA